MKKFKKIMAVLVAAMMIVATMVPAWATTTTGRMEDTVDVSGTAKPDGSITIKNVKSGETYAIYRIFELASFSDTNTDAGVHIVEGSTPQSEAYSYVISEDSAWYEWFTGTGSAYVKEKTSTWKPTTNPDGALFWIEPETVSLKDWTGTTKSNYHVVTATSNFSNTYDVPTTTYPYDTTDYETVGVKNIQDFAKAASAYISTYSGTKPDGKVTISSPTGGKATSNDDISVSNLPLGYYLVTSSEGTLCSLDTTNKSVNIYDKNDEPTITKKALKKDVALGSAVEENWLNNTDANIGDTVYFRIQINAIQGAKNYVLHDIMEDGLTFGTDKKGTPSDTADDEIYGKIEKVTFSRITTPDNPLTTDVDETVWTEYTVVDLVKKDTTFASVTKDVDYVSYSVSTPDFGTNMPDGCDFEITFPNQILAVTAPSGSAESYLDIKDGDIISVYYSATLNVNATVWNTSTTTGETAGTDSSGATTASVKTTNTTVDISSQPNYKHNTNGRNDNHTILTYGNESFTEFATATVTTYQLDIVKTNSTATDPDLLTGAQFSLYRAVERATTDPETPEKKDTRTFNNKAYDLMTTAIKFTKDSTNNYRHDAAGSDILTSDAANIIHAYGLEAGLYILEEDVAPYGYDKLAHPIAVTIIDKEAAGSTEANEGKFQIIFVNNIGKVTNDAGESTPVFRAWDGSTKGSSSTQKQYNSTAGGGLQIVNTTGQELPSTGGMGTTVLYIVGGMLVILAGAYLFFSRKRTA